MAIVSDTKGPLTRQFCDSLDSAGLSEPKADWQILKASPSIIAALLSPIGAASTQDDLRRLLRRHSAAVATGDAEQAEQLEAQILNQAAETKRALDQAVLALEQAVLELEQAAGTGKQKSSGGEP